MNPVVYFDKANAHSAFSGMYIKTHYREYGTLSEKESVTQVLLMMFEPSG